MTEPLASKLAELRARFREGAAAQSDAIARALVSEDRRAVVERAHKLAGNAGIFGEPQIGDAAFELEKAAETGADMEVPGERLLALLASL